MPNELTDKSCNRKILLTPPTPPYNLNPLIESPTDTSSINNKIPAITFLNNPSVNKSKKKHELSSPKYQYSPYPHEVLENSKHKTKSLQASKLAKPSKQKRTESYMENPETTSNVYKKVFARTQKPKPILVDSTINPMYSDTSSTSNTAQTITTTTPSTNSDPKFPKEHISIQLLKQNSQNKSQFRSSISPTYLKKQKLKQQKQPSIIENYFEPIHDVLLDKSESAHHLFANLNQATDFRSMRYREDRKTSKKCKQSQQPLLKLPVHDFSRKTSNATVIDSQAEENDFLLKMMPLKRSLTLENGKKTHIFPQVNHQCPIQGKKAPVYKMPNASQHLDNYLNLHLFNHLNTPPNMVLNNLSSENAQYYFNSSKSKASNHPRPQMYQTTTTTTTTIPKSSSHHQSYRYANAIRLNDCTCHYNQEIDPRLDSSSSKYMNIRDNRYSNTFNANTRSSRKTANLFESTDKFLLPKKAQPNPYHYQQQPPPQPHFSSSFINTKQIKHEHRNFKYYDMNLNLNNILKTNPYQAAFNMETSEEEDDDFLDKSELELSLLKSFHRPHSALLADTQTPNDDIDFEHFRSNKYVDDDDDEEENDNFTDFNLNSFNNGNTFVSPSQFTSVFHNRLNNLQLMEPRNDLFFNTTNDNTNVSLYYFDLFCNIYCYLSPVIITNILK